MKRSNRLIVLTIALLAAGMARAVGEMEIPFEKVPEAARIALTRLAKGERITRIVADTEDDVPTFDAEWVADGKMHSAMVTESGALMDSQVEVPEAQVPEAVKAAAAKQFGKFRPKTYTMVGSITWDVEVSNRNGSQVVSFSPTGKIELDPPTTAPSSGPASQPK